MKQFSSVTIETKKRLDELDERYEVRKIDVHYSMHEDG